MSRYLVPVVLIIPQDRTLDEVGRMLARALLSTESVPIERTSERWVISVGEPPQITAELPLALNEALDNEYATRAIWAIVRLYPREHGRIRVLLKRVSPRHGFLSTYQNEKCRCEECTAANAAATLAYRARTSPKAEPKLRRHGAQCARYGCYCEERREADRLRQRRHRERVAQLKAASSKPVSTKETSAHEELSTDRALHRFEEMDDRASGQAR
jgi:hypothetical protein